MVVWQFTAVVLETIGYIGHVNDMMMMMMMMMMTDNGDTE